MVLNYAGYKIELRNDESYEIGSTDNTTKYNFEYEGDSFSTTKHGVLLKQNGDLIKSAIIFGNEGQTSIHANSAIVFDDMLIICVSNKIFCLYLPTLKLRWVKEVDEITCFQIFKTSESYLVHGELNITRIDFNGDVIWSFSGEDIFVSAEGKNEVELTANGIEITDWNGKNYLLSYDGQLVSLT